MKELKIAWPKVLDWKDITSKPIIRWINLCNGTMFRVTAFYTHTFNNMPREGLFIAIERVCAYLFPIADKIHWEYVMDKLQIPQGDARPFADWINAQLGNKVELYGHYPKHYIDENEPVVYAGEKALLPLCPEIISD